MKILNQFPQGSVEWMIARAGLVTASEADALISPLWKIRTGEGVETYLNKKLAERWTGGPLASANTFDMDQGKALEEHARPAYELITGETVEQVALITDDAGTYGCSPDGLLGDAGGLEIKCPKLETHIGYLRAQELPKDYAATKQSPQKLRRLWRYSPHDCKPNLTGSWSSTAGFRAGRISRNQPRRRSPATRRLDVTLKITNEIRRFEGLKINALFPCHKRL